MFYSVVWDCITAKNPLDLGLGYILWKIIDNNTKFCLSGWKVSTVFFWRSRWGRRLCTSFGWETSNCISFGVNFTLLWESLRFEVLHAIFGMLHSICPHLLMGKSDLNIVFLEFSVAVFQPLLSICETSQLHQTTPTQLQSNFCDDLQDWESQ